MLSSSLSDEGLMAEMAPYERLVPEVGASAFLGETRGGGASVTRESLKDELLRYAGRGNASEDGTRIGCITVGLLTALFCLALLCAP